MERIEAAAAKIKDKVNPDLGGLVNRDRVFLADVCSQLKLDPNPINFAQVSVLLQGANIATHAEYPKMVDGVVVNDEQEEKALAPKAKKPATK